MREDPIGFQVQRLNHSAIAAPRKHCDAFIALLHHAVEQQKQALFLQSLQKSLSIL